MFSDVVASTKISEKLDAEEWREVVRLCHAATAAAVGRYGGSVTQYLGDGVLVYFGYPQAHEDDAVRAVQSALTMLEELPGLNDRVRQRVPAMHGRPLQLRIGVHTGRVVVGEMSGAREHLAFGDTVNIGARLEALAEPDSVVISEATRKLVQGVFVLESLGPRSLKGIADPIATFRVLKGAGVVSRMTPESAVALSPFTGREHEATVLLECWERAKRGNGQVVAVSGDAGLGKSRLVQAFRERIGEQDHSWLECGASSYHQNSVLHPLRELVRQGLLFAPADSLEDKIAKLESGLENAGFVLPEALPLLASMLSLPLPDRYPPIELAAEAQRRKTLEVLSDWVLALAKLQPLVLVMDDLHWVDPTTLEFLGAVVEQAAGYPILVLPTFRPSFVWPWPSDEVTVQLVLSPFSPRQVRSMLKGLVGCERLPDALVEEIVAKSDGVPLFVEELTKSVLESDAFRDADPRHGSTARLAVPSTLADSLMARLDKLGFAKEVAQRSAALGREFSRELLEATCLFENAVLDQALDQLVAAGLLYQRGAPPRATYTFKHALIRDAAYESMLKSTRCSVHEAIARAVKNLLPHVEEESPELLAFHFEEAGHVETAIGYWRLAGERATARWAHLEAIQHFERALALLERQPETAERARQEIELLEASSVPLVATQGYAADAVTRTFERARQLCETLGDTPLAVLYGIWFGFLVRGDRKATGELVPRLLEVAQRSRDPVPQLIVHSAVGCWAFYAGDHGRARDHLARSMQHYDADQHRTLLAAYGSGADLYGHLYMAWCQWYSGYPDRADELLREALGLAESENDPYALAQVLCFGVALAHCRREPDVLRERSERAAALATEHRFPYWLGIATCGVGSADVQSGRIEEGTARIQEGLSILWATGGRVTHPFYLSYLVEAHRAAGALAEGLEAVEEAIAFGESSLSRFHQPELLRLKGELLLARDQDPAAAERCFRAAIDVAREQGARSLELRAAASLFRLVEERPRCDEARSLLEDVYGRFTEGFSTVDLREAKRLLDERV
jgi:class 3 adenylate cyclase/predicted ATPase